MGTGAGSDYYSIKRPEPAEQQPDYYASPKPGSDYYEMPPLARLRTDTNPGADMTATLGAFQPDETMFSVRHPILNTLIVEPIKQVGTAIAWAFKNPQPRSDFASFEELHAAAERTLRYSQEHPEETQQAMRGFALMASFAPSSAAASWGTRFAGAGLRRASLRAASFLSGEFLGGAVYGTIEPIEPGQSRIGNIAQEGALFAGTAGIFAGGSHLLARGFRKYILQNLGVKGIDRAVARLNAVKEDLARAGTSFDALPPNVRDQILGNVYRETVEELEHDALKVEGFMTNEAEGAADAIQTAPSVKSILPDPDQPFGFAEEAAIRSAAQHPKGFIPGAERSFDAVLLRIPPDAPMHPADQAFHVRTGKKPPSVGILSRNVKPGEGPWRISFFQNSLDDAPWGHKSFKTKEEAFQWAKETGFETVDTVERGIEDLLMPTAEPAPKRMPNPRNPKGFEPTADEQILGAVVRDRNGKIHPGVTHPQAMADAINSGRAVAADFEAARGYKLADNMGFRSTQREFMSRAEAGRIADRQNARSIERRGTDLDSMDLLSSRGAEEEIKSTLNPREEPKGLSPEALADLAVRDGVEQLPLQEVSAPDVREATATAKQPPLVPPERVDPLETVRASQPDGPVSETGLDALQTAARMHDSELEALQREFMRLVNAEPPPVSGLDLLKQDMQKIGSAEASFAREFVKKMESEKGAASLTVISRFFTGITGASLMVGSSNIDDDPGTSNSLWAIGAMMVAASLHAPMKQWMKENKFVRNLVLNAAPEYLMRNAGSREGARRYKEILTWSRELAHNYHIMLDKTFPKDVQRAAMIAIDEMDAAKGIFPAEYHSLTPSQQRAAVAVNQFNLRLKQLLRAEGIEDDFIENYARRVLPSETFERWRQQGWRQVGLNKRVRLSTLREFEAFAAAHALPEPTIRLPDIQALRITEAYRAIGGVRTRKMMEGLGLVVDAPKTINQPMPQGWRVIRGIPSLREKMAPEAVAKALENISSPIASRSDILNAADVVKSWWMRSVMFWFWEHGLNAMRALPLVAFNPLGVRHAWKAIADADPGVMEATKYGLNLRARTDYGLRSAKAFEEMAQRVGKIPLIGSMWRAGGWLIEKQDRILWDQIIPSLQYFTYQNEMLKWSRQTANKFLPGSVEYTTAARRAADFANVVAGRVPTELANPQLMQLMRLVMFSPQWTTTRIALAMGAAGELGEIAAGRMNPLHAQYLPFKLRQVAYFVGATWLLSKALSGKEPEFNPRTLKFYARTGWRNATGREVGLDVLGWWQDELKLFNDPMDFLMGRLNPTMKIAGETISGRDFAGRDMTYPQRLENLLRSFGPPTEAAELAARLGQSAVPGGAPALSRGELASRLSGVTATFNVSALPRPMDAAIARLSEKLLDRAHLPNNEYLVFELSRLLRSNILSGQDLIDNRVITYLAYRQRSHGIQQPLGYNAGWLWQHGRKILADF